MMHQNLSLEYLKLYFLFAKVYKTYLCEVIFWASKNPKNLLLIIIFVISFYLGERIFWLKNLENRKFG